MANTTSEPSLAKRVAEARAIKAQRDSERREAEERRQAEEATAARLRARKIAAGLLGVCPHCKGEVDTAEGIVLSHRDSSFGVPPITDPAYSRSCAGTGEQPLGIEEADSLLSGRKVKVRIRR